ncbi:MAG TPA: ABC transporter permease [Candidatus Acidoferrales bacterium]|jgi:putative ABC transport system permease protein|nr:ABC transporter permease [Candidatus Acidoferrales bacterium]
MRWLQKLSLKWRAVLRRSRVEHEMDAELAGHLESEAHELMAHGVPPAEARRRAAATMGRMDTIKEECRDSRGTAGWEQLKQDTGFGIRLLLKNRTFSAMALAAMSLGIGSTTAVFSLIDGVLLRPLPFPAPDRLFNAGDVGMRGPFDTLCANSRLAFYAAHLGVRAFNTAGRDWPERWKGIETSANFFQVLGVSPLRGRTFADGEDRPGKLRVVVLSHAFWAQRFQARPDAIGQKFMLDEAPYEIIGVMPAGFQYPSPEVNFWVPMRLDPRIVGEYWGAGGVMALARLRDGVTPEAAQSELRSWMPRIRAMFPWRMPDAWGVDARLTGLRDHLVRGAKVRSLLLLGVVALVLLIAIVNVANLMIAQTAARQRELTLRASLGATPARLARQLLTEAVLLAAAGGLLGTLLAFGQLALLKHVLPADTPRLAEVVISRRILIFTAALSLGSGLLFGLLPAWGARRQRSLAALEGGRSTTGPMGLRTDAVLVMTEAAFATILLVGAGLLLRSLWTMMQADPGFRVESVVTAELSPDRPARASLAKTVALYEQVRLKLAAWPGMMSVAAMNVLPLTPEFSAFTAAIEDHPRPEREPQYSLWSTVVTPEHLETLGIRLLQGRGFTAADREGAQPVVLISRATANRFWPDRSPIGRRLRPVWLPEWRTIVGVVDDVKYYSITGPPDYMEGEIYLPLAQAMGPPQTMALVARLVDRPVASPVAGHGSDPGAFEKRLPEMIKEVCPNCAVSKIALMETVVSGAVETPRSMAWLVGGFAVLALALAAAGIYGVVSHGVLRRTRELGVRLALGASRGRVAWLVVGSSLRYTLVGTIAGLAASWALARWIRTLLYGVAEHDLLSFSIPPLVLIAVAILASVLPMYRAVRIDPAESLRAS